MNTPILPALLCAVAWSPVRAAVPESVTVRAAAWRASRAPATDAELSSRVAAEVASAAKDGADVIVFPENFAGARDLSGILDAVKAAAGADRLVVLGNSPHRNPGDDFIYSRAYILSGGAWQVMDKLDPTPAERAAKPPVKPGMRLPLFRFNGGTVAVLPASSIVKAEVAASLKKRGVQLILVCAPEEDKEGAARLSRAAAARAVELGAAVLIAPPFPAAPALHLPAQKGFDLAPRSPQGRDYRLPWKRLLELHSPDERPGEPRPFLETSHYQVEI